MCRFKYKNLVQAKYVVDIFCLLALPTQGKDIIVPRFIIEYRSLMDFGSYVVGLFL
jgi:hypothetical protein